VSSLQPNPTLSRNFLLSSLPRTEYENLLPHLHSVRFSLGDLVGDANGHRGFAYFPTTCVVSLVCDMENGASVQVALTGYDGVVGTSYFLWAAMPHTIERSWALPGKALRHGRTSAKGKIQARGDSFNMCSCAYTDAFNRSSLIDGCLYRVHRA